MASLVTIPLPVGQRSRGLMRAQLGRRTLALEWKPQDLWIGLFWKRGDWWSPAPTMKRGRRRETDVWLCLVPMLPIHLHWVHVEGPTNATSSTPPIDASLGQVPRSV